MLNIKMQHLYYLSFKYIPTTTALNNTYTGVSFDTDMDYDDEVDSNGDIDIGEIAAQYLSLEIFQMLFQMMFQILFEIRKYIVDYIVDSRVDSSAYLVYI